MKEITTEIPDPIWQVFYFLASPESKYRYIPREWYEPIVTVKRESLRAHPDSRVDSFCKLECGEGMYIGRYVHIASFTHLGIGGGLLILEEGSSCASGVKIITGSNQPGEGRGCSAIDPKAIIERSFVHVKRNATLYTNAVVCPGVTIGVGAVVLPGAVVTCNVPDGETWGGVPAKRIKEKETDSQVFPITVSYDFKADTELACPNCRKPIFVHNTFPRNDWLYVCPHCRIESKSKSFWWAGKQLEVDRTQIETLRNLAEYTDEGSDIRNRVAAVETQNQENANKKLAGEHTPDRWVEAQAEMYDWDDKESK